MVVWWNIVRKMKHQCQSGCKILTITMNWLTSVPHLLLTSSARTCLPGRMAPNAFQIWFIGHKFIVHVYHKVFLSSSIMNSMLHTKNLGWQLSSRAWKPFWMVESPLRNDWLGWYVSLICHSVLLPYNFQYNSFVQHVLI